MKRIALIGLGPHARRIYYPYIEEMVKNDKQASLELLIDLEMNRNDIESFLSKNNLQPKHSIYLDGKGQINPKTIDPLAAKALRDHKVNKVIISTEPKAHKVYLKECIELGIPVLTDKPVTAPVDLIRSLDAADNVFQDVKELTQMIDQKNGARVLVQCQRRNHVGYQKVFSTLELLIKEFNIPITYISVHHSDGMWNMPNEFFSRENHPYKYGYGKLMHSGYHFVDLLTELFKLSSHAKDKSPDTVQLFSQYTKPNDQHAVINAINYQQFFGNEAAKSYDKFLSDQGLGDFGEIDSYSQIQLKKQGNILTTVQMSLVQSGFSQRAWSDLPQDAYKSNGRIRHEYINIHVGPLASIQIHSYQSKQLSEQPFDTYEVGGNNHFDIYIFRNSNLIGGNAFEKIQYGAEDLRLNSSRNYLGHNENARHQTLDELMYNLPSNSELSSHLATNKLLSEIYKNHTRQTSGKIPFSEFNAKEII